MIKNAMTVDVEDYFQVSAFEPHIRRADWERLPSRVERNCDVILDMFARFGVKATFFVLGWVAERHPHLVRRLVAEGHEVASHGYEHVRVTQQSPQQFFDDASKTKALLEDQAGCPVRGYRAASYSIGEGNLWALEELERAGYAYSSSIYPIRHDLYGMPNAPRFAFYPHGQGGILEIPVTTVSVMNRRLPCGGGGYFRLMPYRLSRWALRRVNGVDGQAGIFYFHPWELDPGQPRQTGIGLKTRFRHYLNLNRVEARLESLLGDFSWGRVDQIFLAGASSAAVDDNDATATEYQH